MAYQSSHTGPEVDAAVEMLSQVQEARDATAADRAEVQVDAQEVHANAVQVAAQTETVNNQAATVQTLATEVEQAHFDTVNVAATAVQARDIAVASASAAQASQTSASASETATTAAAEQASDAADIVSALAPQVSEDAANASDSADAAAASAASAAAVVTGGTATLAPAAGKIPLADGTGKIAEGWMPSTIARSSTVTAATQAAAQATARTAPFLDPSSSNPSTRFDGSALQIGDRYFNTTAQGEYLFTNVGWVLNDAAAAVSIVEDQLEDLQGQISVTPEADAIPRSDANGQIAVGWIPASIARQADLDQAEFYKAAGAGAVDSTVKKKLALQEISVEEFGALGGGADDSAAFQAAIDALPAYGGTIKCQGPSYRIETNPSEGIKSITWMIGTNTVFTGAGTGEGKFGYMLSNPAQLAVGPYIRSRSGQQSSNTNGGIAAFNVEMIQPAGHVGQSVGAYFGAIAQSTDPLGNTWAMNTLIRVLAGAKGTHQCIEIDVDNFSVDALVKGISISGAGTVGPRCAVEIVRANNTPWQYGIDALNTIVGMRVRASTQTRLGLLVGAPVAQLDAVLSAKLLGNAHDGVLLERFTDTSPTGNFLRAVNAANSQNIFSVSAVGNVQTIGNISTSAGYVRGVTLDATGPVSAAPAGVLRLSASTVTTVGPAGGAAALPATPLGYVIANIGGTDVEIPYFRRT